MQDSLFTHYYRIIVWGVALVLPSSIYFRDTLIITYVYLSWFISLSEISNMVFFWLNIKVQPFCLPNPVLFSFLCPLSVLSMCPFWEGVLGMPLVGCTAAMDTSSTSWGGNYQILEATAIMGECPILYECKLSSCSLGKLCMYQKLIFYLLQERVCTYVPLNNLGFHL